MRWFYLFLLLVIGSLATFVSASWPTAAQDKFSSTLHRLGGAPPPVPAADTIVAPTLTPCTPPPANMVSWWPADSNANDIQGGHNGTLHPGATFAAGEVGQAFNFDGTNGYVSIGSGPLLASQPAFTIDAWFNTTSASSDVMAIYSESSSSSASPFVLMDVQKDVQTGQVVFQVRGAAGSMTIESASGFADGNFHHAAAVKRASNDWELFVDGVSVGTSTTNVAANPVVDLADIGRFNNGGSQTFFSGRVDEVELFNRALTQTEIQNIFNAGSAGKCRADVSVTQTDSPDPVAPNSNLTYFITVHNNGPADALNTGLSDTLPASTSLVSFIQNSGPPLTGTLPAGQTATFTLVVHVNPGTPNGTVLTNTANVFTTTTDPNPANNTSIENTTVLCTTTITCPGGITKFTDSGQSTATVNPGTPVANSNCGIPSVTGVRSDGKALNAPYPIGVTIITWTATGAGGAPASCGQSIAVMVPSGQRRKP